MSITKIVRVHAGELLELETALGEARRAGAPDTARVVLDHARVGELEEALREAIAAARDFNRGGRTWREYDALLVRLSALAAAGDDPVIRVTIEASS